MALSRPFKDPSAGAAIDPLPARGEGQLPCVARDSRRRGCETPGLAGGFGFYGFLGRPAGRGDKIRGEYVHGSTSRMRRRSEESTRTIFGFLAFTAASVFVLLLAMGHAGIELFVMLCLILAVTGIQGLVDKFLFDKYRQ